MESEPLIILDAGTGLFGTHVTLEDVNAAIKEHMEIVNELTLDSKMEVIGDGNGFSSKVILISCVWSLPSEELPQKIVLKIVSFAHSKGAIKKSKTEDEKKMAEHYETAILRIHNQEVNFYEVLKTGDSQRLLAPKVYFCQRFSDSNRIKGFIGMEYVERTEVRHSFENCTSEEIQPILKAIAGVQALSLLVSNEELEKIKTGSLYKEIMVAMIVREGTKGILGHLEGKYPGKFTERIGRLESYESNILNYEKAFKLNKHLVFNRNPGPKIPVTITTLELKRFQSPVDFSYYADFLPAGRSHDLVSVMYSQSITNMTTVQNCDMTHV
ncbi:hypothetical protein CAEBREN_29475 [Caenorhabditis brenneri]|uniref:Uncharacterized protein n=1 Tax=Caenorhabditis brenneri TaxID=135651 RepID=G0NBF0_CAEBE|nr:hypothetical protein CAEBREN_29475 [Caenorhabditis brenneri]